MSDMRLAQVYAERDTDDFDERYEGPRFTGYNEELCRKLEESHADIPAGRTRPSEEVFEDIFRKIADGTI